MLQGFKRAFFDVILLCFEFANYRKHFFWIGFTTLILFIGVFRDMFTTCILFLCWFCGINGLYIPLCANCWKNVETVENFWCVELRKNTIIKYQHNTNIIALVRPSRSAGWYTYTVSLAMVHLIHTCFFTTKCKLFSMFFGSTSAA